MKVTLNNRDEIFEESTLTIEQILKIKKFTFPRVVIKINGLLIRKPAYAEAKVADGDTVEIIHLISGG